MNAYTQSASSSSVPIASPKPEMSGWQRVMHIARVIKNLANIPIALLLAKAFMDRTFERLWPHVSDGPLLWTTFVVVVTIAFTRVLARDAVRRLQFPIRFARLDAADKARNQELLGQWNEQRRQSWPTRLSSVDASFENECRRLAQRVKALFTR